MIVFKNLIRSPGRNILLFCIACVLAFVLMAVLFVKDYADEGINDVVGPLNGCLKVSVGDEYELSYRDAASIRDGFGVITGMHAVSNTTCKLEGVEPIAPTGTVGESGIAFDPFWLDAVTDTETMEEFYSGKLRIVEGTGITELHNDSKTLIILISRDLAESNGIELGDPVQLSFHAPKFKANAAVTLYVGGIYDIASSVRRSNAYSHLIPANRVFIPFSVYYSSAYEVNKFSSLYIEMSRLYFEVKAPSAELAAAMQGRIRASSDSYSSIVVELFSPLEEVEALYKLSNTLAVAVSAVGLCFFAVLLMVLLWSLHSRMKEIGIYRAIGAKRRQVSFLIVAESLIVFAAAFAVATAAFTWIAATRGQDIYTALFYSSANGDISPTTLEGFISDRSQLWTVSRVLRSTTDIFINFVLPSACRTAAIMFGSVVAVGVILFLYVRRTEVMSIMGGSGE